MSYWCGAQLVVTIDGPAGRFVVSLAQPFARVGSHPAADVNIPDEAVAPRCLYLHATDEGVFCLYLDIAAHDLEQKGKWLAPDESIAIGPYRVRASLLTAEAGDAVPASSLAAWGSAPAPLPVLMVYCGERLKDKRRFRARLSPVGRRPQCALQLKGNKVSGFHCVLFWEREQLWCVDLNSSNGTQLNGEPLVCERVQIGDRLDVGDFALVFQRLSSGRSTASVSQSGALGAGAQEQVSASPSGELPEGTEDGLESPIATQIAPPPAAAPVPPAPALPEPSLAEIARADEDRILREQLAAEVSELARERQRQHKQWEQTSEQLATQIGQLHDEAARLAGERTALEQSRQQWQGERAELTDQLAERSSQLARLESELAAATATMAERLAQIEQLATPPAPPPEPLGPSPAELAREAENRQLREQMAAELETLARERQALELSRHRWQREQAALAEQLSQQSDQLARQQAELAAAAARQPQQPAPVAEQPIQALAAAAAAPVPPAIVEPAPLPELPSVEQPAVEAESTTVDLGDDEVVLDDFAPPEPIADPPAELVAVRAARTAFADRDQLPHFVSDRLVEFDHVDRRRQLIWWSAGGLGVAVVLAAAATVLWWIF